MEEQNNKKKIYLIASVILGTIIFAIFIVLILARFSKPQNNTPVVEVPNPTAFPINHSSSTIPYVKTIIGKTTEEEVKELPNLKEIKQLPDDKTDYLYTTKSKLRNSEIIVKDNLVVFEKSVLISDANTHPTLSPFFEKYGTPEKEVKGSQRYGAFAKTYIYASKGFTLIGNPDTDELLEIHTFYPTTPDQYISLWGSDIKEIKTEEEFGI